MSVYQDRELACPRCGAVLRRSVCVSLNGNRVPAVIDEIRAGRFQRFPCDGCGQVIVADGPLIYTDFERRHWVGCFPRTAEGAWRLLEHQPAESFRRAMVDHAAPIIRAEADGYLIRTVFGLPALAEKILVWDHALDDVTLEILKLEVLRSPDGPPFDLEHRLRFLGVGGAGEGDVLRLALAGDEVLRVPRAWYEDIAGSLDRHAAVIDAVASGPYVDVGRGVLPGDEDPTWADVKATDTFANLGPAPG